ncbi:ComEC/Rec2 family competence protein [Thermophilibacter sp.]
MGSSASEAPARPDRPLLPPALWALVAVIAVTRLALGAGVDAGTLVPLALGAGVVCATGAALCVRRRGPGQAAVVLVVLAGLCCALLASAGELARQSALADALSSSPVSAWELEVQSDMSEGARGWRGRARVGRGGRWEGVVWLVADEPLDLGSRLRCVGRFSENGDDEWGRSSRMQGIAGTVDVRRVLERRDADGARGVVLGLRAAALQSLDGPSSDARALLAGSVCGHTAAMAERGLDELFARCGVSHLVAVSGGHLVIVAGVLGRLLARTRLRPAPRAALQLGATLLFVAFCGAPASAVRSWAMAAAAELAGLAGRRAHPLSAASVVGIAMALADPGVTGQLGYLLSVTCVCGICALSSYARYVLRVLVPVRAPRRSGRLARGLTRACDAAGDALALTFVSQLVTMPLTCATFGQLSLVAPLANVVMAPFFSALLPLGLVAVALVAAPAAQGVALAACEALGALLVRTLRLLAALPMASVAVDVDEGAALALVAAGLAILLVWWPRCSRRALAAGLAVLLACALAWVARWRLLAPAAVRVLDVGQGDAILVTDGASAVLVDTGPGDEVLAALARNHVLHLDAVVLTHLHDDHAGGLEDVLATTGADEVLVGAGVDPPAAAGARVSALGHGDVLRVGRFSLEVISPVGETDGTDNADSLVLALSYDDGARTLDALLTGDAEADELAAALGRGEAGDVDLLKVGHHGSEASVMPELAAALDAEVSVASAGEGNSYGHPSAACRQTLEESGSRFLCTIWCGDVCVEPGADGPVVSCQRGGEP